MEEWKQTEYLDYWVSNLGRVKSCWFGREKLLKIHQINSGYSIVDLYANKVRHRWLVHRLVAETFIPNPLNLKEIDHINQIKTDNRLENLQWITASCNQIKNPTRSQHRNIYSNRGGYSVVIQRNKENVYLKWFKTLEEAQVNRDIWLLFQ
jgi:hypothetical protein